MLKELEEDPREVSSLEIDRLLEEWGMTALVENLEMMGYRTYAHPKAPGYIFHYPRKAELSPATVRNICTAVRNLHRRLLHG